MRATRPAPSSAGAAGESGTVPARPDATLSRAADARAGPIMRDPGRRRCRDTRPDGPLSRATDGRAGPIRSAWQSVACACARAQRDGQPSQAPGARVRHAMRGRATGRVCLRASGDRDGPSSRAANGRAGPMTHVRANPSLHLCARRSGAAHRVGRRRSRPPGNARPGQAGAAPARAGRPGRPVESGGQWSLRPDNAQPGSPVAGPDRAARRDRPASRTTAFPPA